MTGPIYAEHVEFCIMSKSFRCEVTKPDCSFEPMSHWLSQLAHIVLASISDDQTNVVVSSKLNR